MARGDDLLATIEAIHAAGLDPQLWPKALCATAEITGGLGATLEAIEKPSLRHTDFHYAGLPSAEQVEYADHYFALNPRFVPVMRAPAGKLVWDHQFFDEAAIARSPFYMEFLARMDCRYFLGAVLANSPNEIVTIGVQRSRRQGHVGRADTALFKRLVPHLQQAFDVARRLRGAGEANHSLERALDWLVDGVALVRTDGGLLYANEALQTIARQRDGITIRKGALEFAAADIRARFDAAVASVKHLRSGQLLGSIAVDFHVARTSGAPSYLVSVRPLLDKKHADKGAAAIVFVRDPTRRHTAALHVLREALGLTEAEAALAQALQSGTSPGDYAKAGAVSLNTVYTHLRRIKEKTGCHRMAELIRKLNDLQVPLRVV